MISTTRVLAIAVLTAGCFGKTKPCRALPIPAESVFERCGGMMYHSPPGASTDYKITFTNKVSANFEVVEVCVLLDGAHNPEKVASLARNLAQLYPDRRKLVIFGALDSKSHGEMIASLAPLAGLVVATMPRVLAKPPTEAAAIAGEVTAGVEVVVEPAPERALDIALERAGPDDLVVVTGSLYLVGNVRERWYPTAEILRQGTCWPRMPD